MKTFTVGRQLIIVRADTNDTGGVCAVLEMHHPPETGPPLHVHERENEGFYILEGRYRFTLFSPDKSDKTVHEMSAGEFIMAARGVAHSFRSLGPETGKMLVYFTPAGVEAYFEAGSRISPDDPERHIKREALDQQFGITRIQKKAVL